MKEEPRSTSNDHNVSTNDHAESSDIWSKLNNLINKSQKRAEIEGIDNSGSGIFQGFFFMISHVNVINHHIYV